MKTLSFTGYPGFVGLERIINELDKVSSSYPPYNVVAEGEDNYAIEVAVAGFGKDDITIEEHNGRLTVRGDHQETEDETGKTYLHKGISNRKFERLFALADHVKVTDAVVENGLLTIKLERQVPEELKPRQIKIDYKS